MTPANHRNRTLARLERRNAELTAALSDLLDYVEDCGLDRDGKLTRVARASSSKAYKLLERKAP